jgi:putative FmdB family regulatory protein
MPIYEYEHLTTPCVLGDVFEVKQSVQDEPLSDCPTCHAPVRKRISRIGLSIPKMNSEIRDLGFTKLVRRDDGVYENVTARNGESRYMVRDKPETMPDLSKIIRD